MKVLLSSNTSWYLYNFRASTIRRLVGDGHQVICLSPPDSHSARLESELGARHVALPLEGKSTSILKELRSFGFIWRVVRQDRPDMVFNFTVKMNIYCGLVSALQRIPFANNISGLGTAFIHDSWLFRFVRLLYGWVNRRARHLFFQNEEDLAVFQDQGMLGDTAYTLLPGSGIDLEHFSLVPLPNGSPVTFIMIGRLLGDKGVREYAQACQLLKEQGVPVRCLLLGPLGASNRTAIAEEEVAHWQDEGILEYLGSVDDVRPMIAQSHVLVLPSYREGTPKILLEAASCGLPIVATDIAGCQGVVVEGVNGFLVPVKDSVVLAERIGRLCGDAEMRREMGMKGREIILQGFSSEIVVRETLRVYEELLGEDVGAT